MRAYNAVEIMTDSRKKSEVAICQHDAVGDVETRCISWLETDTPCCPLPCEIAAARTLVTSMRSYRASGNSRLSRIRRSALP